MSDEQKNWRDSGSYRYEIVKAEKGSGGAEWKTFGDFRYRIVKVARPPAPGEPSAFDDLAKRHEAQKMRLKYLRRSFQAAAETLGREIAAIYIRYRRKGDPVDIDIKAGQLEAAFKNG